MEMNREVEGDADEANSLALSDSAIEELSMSTNGSK
jgi:hypothetical protein